jgi:hypothetical protein
LKKLIALFVFSGALFFSSEAYAFTEDKKPTTLSEEDKNKKTTDNEGNTDDVNYVAPKKVTTDSSLHSISKYNFLFYMVYKIKYMDSDYGSSKSSSVEE